MSFVTKRVLCLYSLSILVSVCNTERPSFQLEIQIEIVQQIKLKMFNIQTSEIEQFFFIKLIEAKGGVKEGICTIMEMTVILHGHFELVLKFCDKLKHELSLAAHFTVDADHQIELAELQTKCLTALPNTVDMLRKCVEQAINDGFGIAVDYKLLYRAVAQLMVKVYLVLRVLETSIGPFEDDVRNVEAVLNKIEYWEDWLVRRMKENAPDKWDEVLDYTMTLDLNDDLQLFEI